MAYQEMDYRYVTYGSNPTWSTSTWDIYSGPSSTTLVDYETEGISKYPNSNKVALLLNWNLKQLNVDGNYTVGKIFSNASLGVSNDSDVVVNLNGTTPDGADGTINVDTDYIYSQTGPGASGADTESMRWALYFHIGNEHLSPDGMIILKPSSLLTAEL